VTVGSVIGISSLGNLFTDGINRNIPAEIIVGIVCVLLIAAIFDLILAGVGRLLLPWNRSAASLTRAAERASTLVTQ
jgi:osmoprotectant transport system permease protein